MENKKYLHILVDSCIYLTQYKLYEVEGEEHNYYKITDDEGDRIWVEPTESPEFFKVYEKYTKVRTFDSSDPEGFPQNGKVYDAKLTNLNGEVVCYWAEEGKHFILLSKQCAFLNEGGKWEILGSGYKEESKVLDTDSTEYKIQVMQAFLDGEKIQINDLQEHGWMDWRLGQPIWNWEENSYRIKPKEELKLSIDWSQVTVEYKYLALDSRGDAYLYMGCPELGANTWTCPPGKWCQAWALSSLIIPEGINWKESLVERPK